MTVLVTGGAGFIGSHLVDELIDRGYETVVYDSLDAQVHGADSVNPQYLNRDAYFVRGDIRDRDRLSECLEKYSPEVIFHEAAAVGVGQSMYEIRHYVDVNCLGTATLLDLLANKHHQVRKIIVASSMSIYGEGSYRCQEHGLISPKLRSESQLAAQDWEMQCPVCGLSVSSVNTREDKPLAPTSTYAISKRDQEELVLTFGRAYRIPSVALRYFNVFGTRQSLSNPYTGVAAMFASRILNGASPLIFEDGLQTRDFVHVSDVVQANVLAMEGDGADYQAVNVGTGRAISILDVARSLALELRKNLLPEVLGEYRTGDIRHCVADNDALRSKLAFEPKVSFEEGMRDLVMWLKNMKVEDLSELAMRQLRDHGLTEHRLDNKIPRPSDGTPLEFPSASGAEA